MIAITMLKIDEEGRITLPDYFLKANDIKQVAQSLYILFITEKIVYALNSI